MAWLVTYHYPDGRQLPHLVYTSEHIWYCRVCDETSTPGERCPHPAGMEEED
jgi:hypothetical protein